MKFSVVIPAYNYGHFIGACLESVINQTYANWECLVVDDASTDNTSDVVKSYCAKDSRISYYRLTNNNGPSLSRNYALDRITGDYILFLDADDLIAPQKLQQAAEVFTAQSVDFMFTNYAFFKEAATARYNMRRLSDEFGSGIIRSEDVRNKLVHENPFVISCIISKKECLESVGNFDSHLNYNEDWDLWLRTSFKNPVYYCDHRQEGITLIRNHGTSLSKYKTGMYINGLYVCKKNYGLLDDVQKKIMDKKICIHRYILKTILVDNYYEDHEQFLRTLRWLDRMPFLEDELRSFRKRHWHLPKACCGLYLKLLHFSYRITLKCL